MVCLVGYLGLVVVILDVATVPFAMKLCIEGMHFVTVVQIVSPLAVVEMLDRSGLHFVTLKVHKHGWSSGSVVVPRIEVRGQMTSSH